MRLKMNSLMVVVLAACIPVFAQDLTLDGRSGFKHSCGISIPHMELACAAATRSWLLAGWGPWSQEASGNNLGLCIVRGTMPGLQVVRCSGFKHSCRVLVPNTERGS
jgi:hypothetical protein